jgi:hypothetical protein
MFHVRYGHHLHIKKYIYPHIRPRKTIGFEMSRIPYCLDNLDNRLTEGGAALSLMP